MADGFFSFTCPFLEPYVSAVQVLAKRCRFLLDLPRNAALPMRHPAGVRRIFLPPYLQEVCRGI
jgi:hypothetical protein